MDNLDPEGMNIQETGFIFTSFQDQARTVFSEKDYFDILNKLDEKDNEKIEEERNKKKSSLIGKVKKLDLSSLVENSSSPITSEIKKKITKIRNKNTHNYLLKSGVNNLVNQAQYLKKKIFLEKGIKDPSKSLTFFFVDLAIFKMETYYQFLDVLDETKTIKSNKLTHEFSAEEEEIVKEEIEFYKKITLEFLYGEPAKAILKAYLRNHDIELLKKRKLNRLKKQAIEMTINILNSEYFNFGIDMSILNEY